MYVHISLVRDALLWLPSKATMILLVFISEKHIINYKQELVKELTIVDIATIVEGLELMECLPYHTLYTWNRTPPSAVFL